MIKLDHHRQLGVSEIIRKGDFYKDNGTGVISPVKHSIGRTPRHYRYGYTFWRRLHTKKPTVAVFTPYRKGGDSGTFKKVKPDAKPKAKVPVVRFTYKGEQRMVHVISMDDKYISGLERTCEGYGKYKYQFKKFLTARAGTVELAFYGHVE